MSHLKLGNRSLCLKWLFYHISIPDLSIVTNTVDFLVSPWNIDCTCESNVLLIEILIEESRLSFDMIDQIPEENVSTLTCRNKACVVLIPVDGSNFLDMTFALELRWWGVTIVSVEIVHIRSITVSSSKEMTTVTELNFSTAFNWNTFKLLKRFREDVHK